METLIPAVATALLIAKVIDFLKHLSAGEVRAAVTQALAWIAGVSVIFLTAQTDFASGIEFAGSNLAALNAASLVFVGLWVASTGSFAIDVKKAIDNTDSAKVPPLGGE